MKKIFLFFILMFFIGCSSLTVINDSFDNSHWIYLPMDRGEFIDLSGEIEIVLFYLSKEFKKDSTIATAKLSCKFEGYKGEMLEGNTIEVKTDDVIHKLKLNESRFGVKEKTATSSSTTFTWIGAFTYTDTTRSNVNIIAMETVLTKEVLGAMKNAKSISFRILTKNIDGVSKNTFKYKPYVSSDLKEFVDYQI